MMSPPKQQCRLAVVLAIFSAIALGQPESRPKKITLDAWFNIQQRKNASSQTEYFHYKWNDTSDSGFSLFAEVWREFGVATSTLYSAPTVEDLKGPQFYLIVSPDIPAKTRHLVVKDREAIVSPRWSIHAGVGTQAYSFCWGMGGENQDCRHGPVAGANFEIAPKEKKS